MIRTAFVIVVSLRTQPKLTFFFFIISIKIRMFWFAEVGGRAGFGFIVVVVRGVCACWLDEVVTDAELISVAMVRNECS